jgi:hypothetical protein
MCAVLLCVNVNVCLQFLRFTHPKKTGTRTDARTQAHAIGSSGVHPSDVARPRVFNTRNVVELFYTLRLTSVSNQKASR